MFKSLRDRFRRAGKQAEAEIEPQLDLSYEAYRPEEREKGAVVQAKHLENVMWELELALLESDVAIEAVEALKAKLQQRLVGLRVASRGEIAPTIEKALKASLIELLSLESFDPQQLLTRSDGPLVIAFVGVNGTGKTTTIARLAYWLSWAASRRCRSRRYRPSCQYW